MRNNPQPPGRPDRRSALLSLYAAMKRRAAGLGSAVAFCAIAWSGRATANEAGGPPAFFPAGAERRLEDLPPGPFRDRLAQLPPESRGRAMEWLRGFSFPAADVASLHVDAHGGICYGCHFHGNHHHGEDAGGGTDAGTENSDEPRVALAAVPISPFPASLVFQSRPGAPNVIYLNFAGETVSGTAWNDSLARSSIPALPFSTDSDHTTFSDAEQLAIQRIWQRMAEDFAPFNVNVTTARPSTFTTRTAMALITRNTDANGAANPASTAGGVAYVNVFARSDFAKYRPAWVYHNNLSNNESLIAEAASHEVGHNLGLSHDGTSTQEYYGGHGSTSDPLSWGPIMGAGYNRNVSQWSKGEYLNANNPEDDLSIIVGKLGYRTDDHGGTPASATPLAITNGTQIVSTTPQNDPTNSNPANKGVIERNSDVDVFSFVTGSGTVRLQVDPWIQPAGTRGGNLHLWIELYNEAGSLVASHRPTDRTHAWIETNLVQGRYYLYVKNTGVGAPTASPSTGYTVYGSIGQYFMSGFVQNASGFVEPPVAELQSVPPLEQAGQASKSFTVAYVDNVAIDVSTLGTGDIRVTGPNGYDRIASFVSVNNPGNGTPRSATYQIGPPAGSVWLPQHNGTYTVSIEAGEVGDVEGAFVAAGELGQFVVSVPLVYFFANMDANPGWSLDTGWQYGKPNYSSGGPPAAFTGTNIIATNLSGNYPNNTPARYATTPLINTTGATSLTLRFRRWLGMRNIDTATIQASADGGGSWVTLWSSSANVSDSSWQLVQYALPSHLAGSANLRLRWGLTAGGSGGRPSAVGWNIDDVELLGAGTLDTDPPAATLSISNLTTGDSPAHACGVTYADATAVRLSSLDSLDLRVTGPNGYSVQPEYTGADRESDGSPVTGTYAIPAPGGGVWSDAHNGTYTVTLLEAEVEDTLANATPQAILGNFEVAIAPPQPGILTVESADGLVSSGIAGGPFHPEEIIYTLENSGSSPLQWNASASTGWITLGASGGSLAPGTSTSVSVRINETAETLQAGQYAGLVSFANASGGAGDTSRTVALKVEPEPEPEPYLVLRLPGRTESGAVRILIQGKPGTPILLEACADLLSWETIATGTLGEDGTLLLDDPESAGLPSRFYRVVKKAGEQDSSPAAAPEEEPPAIGPLSTPPH
jgi:hypothetical protein